MRVARPTSQVVVRAGAPPDSEPGDALMPRVPTLVGHVLGEASAQSTLVGVAAPTWNDDEPMEPLPARTGKRVRPEILIEDVDHELAERYRRQAQRILAAGFFS